MIAATELDAIRASVNLVDLVGRRVKLDRKGRVFWGCCPFHKDGSPSFKVERELAHYHCFGCGAHGDAVDWLQKIEGLTFLEAVQSLASGVGIPAPTTRTDNGDTQRAAHQQTSHGDNRSEIARSLWKRRKPLPGTVVEVYLRARGLRGPFPATLGFLPPSEKYPDPTMIAAMGIASELEPGVISIRDQDIRGVHLTRLAPDGSDRLRTKDAKIMLGTCKGSPICIAPPNDLLGLAITEGVEDALSVHEATGLGAWAAGSASFMPALAAVVPDYIESVSIMAHQDAAGLKGAGELADALMRRSISASIVLLDGGAA